MTKLILLRAINFTRYLSCSIFWGRLAPWTTNMCLNRLGIIICFCHSGYTVLANRAGWQVAGDLLSRESLDNSCWDFVYIYDAAVLLCLAKDNLEAGAEKWQKGPRGILTSSSPPSSSSSFSSPSSSFSP